MKRKMSNRFVIITGGECDTRGISLADAENAFVIAADSGYDTAKKLGVRPDLLVGDMDSIKDLPTDVELYRVKSEKDDTDTMLAAEIARSRGADEIVIIGGGGGRADHFLSNVFLLESLWTDGIKAELCDGVNVIRFVCDETVRIPKRRGYFGLIALEDCTVTAEGCKYPLKDTPLQRRHPYAVSNEVTSDEAVVSVKGKLLLIISSK